MIYELRIRTVEAGSIGDMVEATIMVSPAICGDN